MKSLQAFLRFQTVCDPAAPLSVSPASAPIFTAARQHVETTYAPFLNSSDVTVTHVNTHSMLIEWQGSRPQLPGVLVYGHYDVVPVAKNVEAWTQGPWSGAIHDGCSPCLSRWETRACWCT